MRFHIRAASDWSPPWQALDRVRSYRDLKVGMVIGLDFAAWEVTHISPMVEPDESGRDMRATLHRLHGPKAERENQFGDMAVRYGSTAYGLNVYRSGRVWLCSCCSDPAPCRLEVAEEVSGEEAREFEERLKRMAPGLCYACGEVITQRQDRIAFAGDHADFPGRSGPTFHTRKACRGERWAYAKRAGVDINGQTLGDDAPATGELWSD